MRNDSNYILYEDVKALMQDMKTEFPELISVDSIGLSFENRTIPLITMTLAQNSSSSSLLLTGAHHSRELASIQLPLYAVLHLIYKYLHGDPTTTYMLSTHRIMVVPVVNVDGFKMISDHFVGDTGDGI